MIRINDPEIGSEILKSPIQCVAAKIVHDNEGKLVLEYHGEAETESGKTICLDIENINLDIDTLKCTSCSSKERFISINCNCMTIPLRVMRDDGITIRYKEKEMTKEEIEKLLGYKIKIVG